MEKQRKIIKENAEVISQEEIATDIFSMWMETEVAKEARAGQFISLFTGEGSKLLPRPISICELDVSAGLIRIVYRVTGEDTGTKFFSQLKKGDFIEVMGPLGNGFCVEDSFGKKVLLVGGGIGIPPMLQLGKEFVKADVVLIMGYADEIFLTDELKEAGRLVMSYEGTNAEGVSSAYDSSIVGDFSTGNDTAVQEEISFSAERSYQAVEGNVMDAIKAYEHMNVDEKAFDVIYACGPLPMLRAVKEYAIEKGIPLYLSMEEKMACGIGACLACVCKSAKQDGYGNVKRKRICKDGPVFFGTEVEL